METLERVGNSKIEFKADHHIEDWMVQLTADKLTPEEKVNLAIGMSDTCVHICTDALRDHDKTITEAELFEKVRARIMYNKRRHHEV